MTNRIRLPGRLGRTGRPLRVAYGRIFHEANAFSPLSTNLGDFERFHLYEGDALAARCPLRSFELKGYLRNAELSGFCQAARWAGGVEAVPLLSALTVPSGPIARPVFDAVVDRLVSRLRLVDAAGRLDGLYLALHGSMGVRDLEGPPEAEILRRVRGVLGDRPIAVSLDLHANLTPALVGQTTLLCGYRTNPHRDLFPVGWRAGSLLLRTLRGQVEPTRAWRKLPVVLGGGVGIDFMAPMRAVFHRLRGIARDPRVLDATLFMVHPYSDAPDLGWAVHVTTDAAPELAERYAEELADRAWAERAAPLPRLLSAPEAVRQVRRARLARAFGPVSLVDVGDAVGTGAPGGSTHLLSHLVEADAGLRVYVPLHDPAAVQQCEGQPLNKPVSLTLRGTPGLPVQPAVSWRPRLTTWSYTDFGRTALLQSDGLSVAVTDRSPLTLHPAFWRDLGCPPRRADAIVQKSLFHYRMFYALVSPRHLPVDTAGASSLEHVRGLRFTGPTYPMEDPAHWLAGDHRLRIAPE